MSNSVLSESAVTVACDEDGTLATKGSRTWGQRIGVYLASVGLKQPNDYCAAFVYWSFEQAAKQLHCANPLPKTGSVPSLYRFGKSHGLLTKNPERGDIYIAGDKSHTGIVEITPKQASKCHTIEGNTWTGDHEWGVHRRTRDLSDAFFLRVV